MKLANSLTASKLRIILSATLALIVIAGGVIFYLAYQRLGEFASEVGIQVASSKESQNTIQQLQVLKQELESQADTIDRASQIAANSENYVYQDRLVNDLTVYASRANLGISVITFSSQAQQATAAPATTEGATAATPGAAAADTAPGGLKKATVDITLQNPVNYQDLLNFLHYVETNLTKMKVSKVTLTKSDANGVTIDVLNLEVYLR